MYLVVTGSFLCKGSSVPTSILRVMTSSGSVVGGNILKSSSDGNSVHANPTLDAISVPQATAISPKDLGVRKDDSIDYGISQESNESHNGEPQWPSESANEVPSDQPLCKSATPVLAKNGSSEDGSRPLWWGIQLERLEICNFFENSASSFCRS